MGPTDANPSPHQKASPSVIPVPILDLDVQQKVDADAITPVATETSALHPTFSVTFGETYLDEKHCPSPGRHSPHRRPSGQRRSSEPRRPSGPRRYSVSENVATHTLQPQTQGIYWRSPNSMVGFFVCGVLACVAHHLYYLSWDGKEVGTENQQQWALRFGTAFAYLAQVSLVCSTGLAFTQYLWLTLKNSRVSIVTLDVAFEADKTIMSILNPEFVRKMKVVAFLSLIAWCLPLPSLVTPGTLLVFPAYHSTTVQHNVRQLELYGPNLGADGGLQAKRLAYSVKSTHADNTTKALLLGPRTILSRLSTATATLGQILPIDPPFLISNYSQKFFGPSIQCGAANASIAETIKSLREDSVRAASNVASMIQQHNNSYFAFVPDFSRIGDKGVQVVATTRFQQPSNASNELWMAYSRYETNETGQEVVRDHYTVCRLFNASYTVDVITNGTSQTVNSRRLDLNVVDYPDANAEYSPDLIVQHAYSAFMWATTDLLVGSIGIFEGVDPTENSTEPMRFSEITTQIEHTSLLGTSDLFYFFDAAHQLNHLERAISDQRRQDIDLARGRTLEVLIPELAENITMSLMSSTLISPNFMTAVNQTTMINVYAYRSSPLLTAYGLSIGFALVAVCLGAFAYKKNGHSHSRSFSAILAATRDHELEDLFRPDLIGTLPLDETAARTRLVLSPWMKRESAPDGGIQGHNAPVREITDEYVGWGFQVSHEGKDSFWDRVGDRIMTGLKTFGIGSKKKGIKR